MLEMFNTVGMFEWLFDWGRDVWMECFKEYALPVIILAVTALIINIPLVLMRKRFFTKAAKVIDDVPADTLQRADEDEKPRRVRFGDSTAALVMNIVLVYVFHFAGMVMIECLLDDYSNDMDRMKYYIVLNGLFLVYWLMVPLIFQTDKYMSWAVLANYLLGLRMQYYWIEQYHYLVDRIYSMHTDFLNTLTLCIVVLNIAFFALHMFIKKKRSTADARLTDF